MKSARAGLYSSLLVLALACAAGCDPGDDSQSGDTNTGGAGGTDGQDPNDGEGQFVQCCYFVTNYNNDGREGCVPQNSAYHACVDPDGPFLDTNGSGDVDASEFAAFCNEKVPSGISTFDPWAFPFLQPDGEGLLDIEGPWTSANSTGGNLFGSCLPDVDPMADYPGSAVPPTHEGSFTNTTPHASSIDVSLDGAHQLVSADGDFQLAISDCESVRHLETCYLDLRSLSVDLQGPVSFAEYSLDTALLSLQQVTTVPVTFDCSDGTSCVGSFDFGTRSGTSLDVLLQWDQTNLSTGAVGGGLLRLGESGLAKMSRVLGELDLDVDKKSGTLRLRGGGSDTFGGAFATIDFDLAGPVAASAVP